MCNIGEIMIRCHLSRIMGEHKMKIADVARATGLNRSTVTALYDENATRIDLETIEKLCRLFECDIGEMLEITD
jgi:putative transcriptional regulator